MQLADFILSSANTILNSYNASFKNLIIYKIFKTKLIEWIFKILQNLKFCKSHKN